MGANDEDNRRYRDLLQYMEDRRQEAKERQQEDEERKARAEKRKKSFRLLKLSMEFLREKEDKWRVRKIEECERIKEEEKKDRLAMVKEKKRWYGLKKLSKDENLKIKMRTEERLEISRGKTNLWRKFGLGREVKEMEEDEWEAWEAIRLAVLELEEEGEWRDSTMRAGDIIIRKPILKTLRIHALESKEERPQEDMVEDCQGWIKEQDQGRGLEKDIQERTALGVGEQATKRSTCQGGLTKGRDKKEERLEYQEDTVRKQPGVRDDERTRCAPTPNCFAEGQEEKALISVGEGGNNKSMNKKRGWGRSEDDQEDRGKESTVYRELKPRIKRNFNFIDKNMTEYKSNKTVRKLVAEIEDRGKESSMSDSGGIFHFGKVVAKEQEVCSPLKRRRLICLPHDIPVPPDGQGQPPSAPWTWPACSPSSGGPCQSPTLRSPGARRRRPPSTPTRLRRAAPPPSSSKGVPSPPSSENNLGTRRPPWKGTTHGTWTRPVSSGRGSSCDKNKVVNVQTSAKNWSRIVQSMAGSICTNHAELPPEAHPLQAADDEGEGVEGHHRLHQGQPAQDGSSDMLFGSCTISSQPETSVKDKFTINYPLTNTIVQKNAINIIKSAKNTKEAQILSTKKGNNVTNESKKKEESLHLHSNKEGRRRSGRFEEAIQVFQKSNTAEPYLHVPGPQAVPGELCTRSSSGTAASSSSTSRSRGRTMSSQEGFRGQGGGTGSLQEVQNSISSGR